MMKSQTDWLGCKEANSFWSYNPLRCGIWMQLNYQQCLKQQFDDRLPLVCQSGMLKGFEGEIFISVLIHFGHCGAN